MAWAHRASQGMCSMMEVECGRIHGDSIAMDSMAPLEAKIE